MYLQRVLGSSSAEPPTWLMAHWRRLVGLCAMSPNEAIWCGSDLDAMGGTGWFCAMSPEQLSVFGKTSLLDMATCKTNTHAI